MSLSEPGEMGDSQSDSQSTFQDRPIWTALSELDERVDPITFGSTHMRLAVCRLAVRHYITAMYSTS
eukprot:COSAG01_NODE_1638_length_9653_cov_230.802282_4_plen_67_part_00